MTKALDGSARYGASSWPNCFSVAGFVLPTMIGTSFGNEDSEGKDLNILVSCVVAKEEKEMDTWIGSCRCKVSASLDCVHLHRRSCSSIETCQCRGVVLLFLCRRSGFLEEWRICHID